MNTTGTGGDVQDRHWIGKVRGSQDRFCTRGDVEPFEGVALCEKKNRMIAKGFVCTAGTRQRPVLPTSRDGRKKYPALSDSSLEKMNMITCSGAWGGASRNLLSLGEPYTREIGSPQ